MQSAEVIEPEVAEAEGFKDARASKNTTVTKNNNMASMSSALIKPVKSVDSVCARAGNCGTAEGTEAAD
jgi:hypothetical protein